MSDPVCKPAIKKVIKKAIKKAGVIGWPIGHSRSPLIHRHWLTLHQLCGSYDPIAVLPEAADDYFRNFRMSGLIGANVTIPHKQTVIAHLDRIDASAEAIGAVNTIWLEDGILSGTNTDWQGFLGNLDAAAEGWDKPSSSALVLGAGGAARGIVYALRTRGFEKIHLANRSLDRAVELQRHFGPSILPHRLDEADDLLSEVDLLVNTTSLGMAHNPPLDLDLRGLKSDCLVTDIVYAPLRTPLLEKAAAMGNRTVDGLGMLLHQAAPGFERWFGIRPSVSTDLRALVLADMDLAS